MLAALAVGCGGLGAAIHYSFRLRAITYISPTPFLGLLFVVIAVGLWIYGRKVLALKEGQRGVMASTTATNIAVFAYVSAWLGAGFLGLLIGLMLPMLADLEAQYVRQAVNGSAVGAAGACALLVVAIIVERWCQLDDDDDAPSARGLEPEAG